MLLRWRCTVPPCYDATAEVVQSLVFRFLFLAGNKASLRYGPAAGVLM